ncbi:MAG TPA: thioredoxin domain-containing protein [archaeon]|nr:thioredoxin domain-containing protein [archaeon]
MSYLIMFYGTECTHCHTMDPLVDKLEKEIKIKVDRLEVWHNQKNAKIFAQLPRGRCLGVPFFINKKTDKIICGETSYENLKKWAQGK